MMNVSSILGLGANAVPLMNMSALSTSLSLGLTIPGANILGTVRPPYEQCGPVYNGPGSLTDYKPFLLMRLETKQLDCVEQGKKYAMDENVKAALVRQTRHQAALQPTVNKKVQTLTLLSRVYVGSISYDIKEETIKLTFQPFGPIKNITMSWDAVTQKHKGFAFIEFEYAESAHMAIEHMNNMHLGGRQLKVGRPSNLPNAEPLVEELVNDYKLQKKVFVSAVHPNLTEEDLMLVFEAFGKISSCKLTPDPNRLQKHRGFGYIEYEVEQSANDAVANMNNFDLGGQFLRVSKAVTPPEEPVQLSSGIPQLAAVAAASATAKVMALNPENGKIRSPAAADGVNMAESDHMNGSRAALSWDHIEAQESSLKESFDQMDEDDVGTLEHQENFQIRGRDARNIVMQKLLRPPLPGVMILRNMVGPEDCDDELENEVKDECSNCGSVDRVVIYQELDETNVLIIKIFVVFQQSESIDQAIQMLNGRYFAGRQVIAEPYDLDKFNANDLTG